MNKTIDELRYDFEALTRRSLSLPLAGMTVWLAVAVVGLVIAPGRTVMIMLFGTGAIFPLAILVARLRGEKLFAAANPLARLMGLCVLMVNLLWAVHIALLIGKAPDFLPLTIGIGLGLHWVVYSWIVGHSLGILHAVLRTATVTAAWFAFPSSRVSAVAFAVVAVYAVSIFQMATRPVTRASPAAV